MKLWTAEVKASLIILAGILVYAACLNFHLLRQTVICMIVVASIYWLWFVLRNSIRDRELRK